MAHVKAKASLDSSNFQRGVKQMDSSTQGLGAKMGALKGKIGGVVTVILAIAAAAFVAAKKLIDFGSELSDQAYQAGVTVEKFQKLMRAVRAGGGDAQTLTNALTRLRDAQGGVVEGDQKLIKAFEKLGLSEDQVASMSMDQIFVAMGKALKDSNAGAREYAAIVDLIGAKNAPKLVEALQAVGGGLDATNDKFGELTDNSAQRLDAMADKIAELGYRFKTMAANWFIKAIDTNVDLLNFVTGGWDKVYAKREEREAKIAQREAKRKEVEAMKADANALIMEERREKKRLESEQKIKDKIKSIGEQEIQVSVSSTADSLAKIGGMIGGQSNPMLPIASRQLAIQEQQRSIQEQQKELLRQVAANTKERNGLAA